MRFIDRQRAAPIHYPFPWPVARRLANPLAAPRPGLFRADSQACVARLRPPLAVIGREHIPAAGPCLLTVNHFHRPGFAAWWVAFAISAVVPADVHWVITSALTFHGLPGRRVADPVVRWGLRRIARLYGFTTMPPMPPRPRQTAERAWGVRQVLRHVARAEQPVVGLAPEGGDAPGGVLQRPPPGVGRFITHLAAAGLGIVPIGVYESASQLCVSFGPRYELPAVRGTAGALDRQVAETVSRCMAALLPRELRGEFG